MSLPLDISQLEFGPADVLDLAQKTGSSLVPPASDIKASIKFEAACSYELNNFVFEAQTIGVEKFIKPTL